MKKLFIAAIMVVTLTATAFATPVTVNTRISSSFASEFASASNLTLAVNSNFSKAFFILDGKAMEAFYDLNGEKIGTSHAISVASLAKKAQTTIAVKYAGYKVTEAISFDKAGEGEQYYVSLENEKNKVVLEITAGGNVSVFSQKAK